MDNKDIRRIVQLCWVISFLYIFFSNGEMAEGLVSNSGTGKLWVRLPLEPNCLMDIFDSNFECAALATAVSSSENNANFRKIELTLS